MMKTVRAHLVMLLFFSVVFGLVYPTAVWAVGKLIFPQEAQGSLLLEGGHIVGSDLIGQPFSSERYFASRPSATAIKPYNFMASGGSNLNPANPLLLKQAKDNLERFRPYHNQQMPIDLVTASASGLDPHISPASAFAQAERVAHARKIPLSSVRKLVERFIETPTFGFIGQARVNVLRLNLALDRISGIKK